MTPLEREAKFARWPQGDAGDAIDFACDHCPVIHGGEPIEFLEDWRMGRADEWSNYMRWLKVQRDGARAAQAIEAQRAETAQTGSVADESAVPNGDAPKGGSS